MKRQDPLPSFSLSVLPEIVFGVGCFSTLPARLAKIGARGLCVTGAQSFESSPHFEALKRGFSAEGLLYAHVRVGTEPSPTLVDHIVESHRGDRLDWVLAVGGGSVIDAGKAVSAMLLETGSVRDFLEGMETRQHSGRKVPFIAVPTSSGTGAEATKNAVLSEVGEAGFKRSLRHDNFMPNLCLVDPELTRSCSQAMTAACGLDALTQLIEAYVSTKASVLTDAWALTGIERFARGFLEAYHHGQDNIAARADVAYAAMISGIVLSQAGLGLVHGFAGPIGGRCTMPHGEVCGRLLPEATRATWTAMLAAPQVYSRAIDKYCRVATLLLGAPSHTQEEAGERLLSRLSQWVEEMRVPRLSAYGLSAADIPAIVARSNGKNSPITLSTETMSEILYASL